MISVSRLLCDTVSPGDHLRYRTSPPEAENAVPRPVVVWNCTRQCNLKCLHCYASASSRKSAREMGTMAGKALLRDLAEFGVPVVLFSGGEPLLRKDFFTLTDYAHEQGLRIAVSTNGTLINAETARKLGQTGFAEVGISLDGIRPTNDRFRGREGAYESALNGIRHCVQAGLRVSLRLTITGYNYKEIPAIFDLAEAEGINRLCFYHLAYSGRGNQLYKQDIGPAETRSVIDYICQRTIEMRARGQAREVLTVDNPADGVYLYIKTQKEDPARAARVLALLQSNGGNASGMRISSVDDGGDVHPDQFWWHYGLGNVRQRKFGDIWSDSSEPLLQGLRHRRQRLHGRCARCRYLDICNGGLRVRAEAVYGDVWAPDPACYLSDEEIGMAS